MIIQASKETGWAGYDKDCLKTKDCLNLKSVKSGSLNYKKLEKFRNPLKPKTTTEQNLNFYLINLLKNK